MSVERQRVYDFIRQGRPEHAHVVLTDGIWPRGVRKQRLGRFDWAKQLAPSPSLRKWFGHRESRWETFQRRYRDELRPYRKQLERLARRAGNERLILLYSARDTQHNQAVVLEQIIKAMSSAES